MGVQVSDVGDGLLCHDQSRPELLVRGLHRGPLALQVVDGPHALVDDTGAAPDSRLGPGNAALQLSDPVPAGLPRIGTECVLLTHPCSSLGC